MGRKTKLLKLTIKVLYALILNEGVTHPSDFSSVELELVKLPTFKYFEIELGLEKMDPHRHHQNVQRSEAHHNSECFGYFFIG